MTSSAADFAAQRLRMVETQLAARGIRDPRVLRAMATVPRHEFLPPDARADAYADFPVPLGRGQTISQPYIVAWMTESLALEPGLRVLEIGAGSGYQTAILAELGVNVYAVERIETLADRAADTLLRLGYEVYDAGDEGESDDEDGDATDVSPTLSARGKIILRVGDGSVGWPEEAPFDRILVAAAAPAPPAALRAQLADGGVLLVPTGKERQRLTRVARRGEAYESRDELDVMFVPLLGAQGFSR